MCFRFSLHRARAALFPARSFLASFVLLLPTLAFGVDQPLAAGAWSAGQLPISFTYDGKPANLSGWQRSDETVPSEGGQIHRYHFRDPATSLELIADLRTFQDFPAIDWVLRLKNNGTADTPIIEDLQPLHWTMPLQNAAVLHWASGSNANPDDFHPHADTLTGGRTLQLNSSGGRSSNNNMPFFNVQDGDHGTIGAIGWTGNWIAHFNVAADGKAVTMDAGMQKTHFLLHPGEMVRTPRLVFLDWKGTDVDDAQNQWRRFVLAHYSPREPDGKVVTLPACLGTWGSDPEADRLKVLQQVQDKKVPLDAYWMDAGWYGTSSDWPHQRGSWTPNPQLFPDGTLHPLGVNVHNAGLDFVVWLEAETADPGSASLTAHPDWYLRNGDPNAPGLLNLGSLPAWAGITGILSHLVTSGWITIYRQDFNVEPDGYWAKNDAPDRVGYTEMKDIEGLYSFWDEMRWTHPGLQIDNCASGGRRLDIETMSRSMALWRSDLCCGPHDPIANQMFTQGLNIWVPLNAGASGAFGGPSPQAVKDADAAATAPTPDAGTIYAGRSCYSAGLVFGTDRISLGLMKPMVEEFHDVRPFFQGDFYPLVPYSNDQAQWAIWQLDRPDMKAGVVLCFRRAGNGITDVQLPLRAIDPQAQYDVEMRSGWGKVPPQTMSGQDLAHLKVTIADKPGSLVVFYKEQQ